MKFHTSTYRGCTAVATLRYDRRAKMWLVECGERGEFCPTKRQAVTALWDMANNAAIHAYYERLTKRANYGMIQVSNETNTGEQSHV